MPVVRFTRNLERFFPVLAEGPIAADGETVAEIVAALDQQLPGLASYLVDETGALRKHVNIFVGQALVQDRRRLSDRVPSDAELYVVQALSGG